MADIDVLRRQQQVYEGQHQNYSNLADAFNKESATLVAAINNWNHAAQTARNDGRRGNANTFQNKANELTAQYDTWAAANKPTAPTEPRTPTTDEAAALRGETNPAALAMSEQSKRSALYDRVKEMREKGILARVMGGDLATQRSAAKPILGI